jgi:O-antigen/teichoic acid export membrane protein
VQIAAPIQILSSVLIVFIAPIYFSLSGDDGLQSNKQLIRAATFRIATAGLCLVAVLFVMVELFHKEIYSLLVSRNFSMDSHYLPLMIASSGILGISQIFCTQLYSELRIKEVMYAGISSGFIGIVLNIQLGITYGLTGIIWAQCIFSLVNFLWLLFLTISKRSSNV